MCKGKRIILVIDINPPKHIKLYIRIRLHQIQTRLNNPNMTPMAIYSDHLFLTFCSVCILISKYNGETYIHILIRGDLFLSFVKLPKIRFLLTVIFFIKIYFLLNVSHTRLSYLLKVVQLEKFLMVQCYLHLWIIWSSWMQVC